MAEIKANVKMLHSISAGKSNSYATVTREYKGVENEGAAVVVDNKANTIEVTLKPHSFASRLEFPNVGNEAFLYVDEGANKVYRWNNATMTYCCVGSDYTDIKIINGGNANGKYDSEQ